MMRKKRFSFILYSLVAVATAGPVSAGIHVTYPAYSAEIVDTGQLQIRRGEAGLQLFREMFSAFRNGGKAFFEYRRGMNCELEPDFEKGRFVCKYEKSNQFRLTKVITLQPARLKVEYTFTNLSPERLHAVEYSILLPGNVWCGKNYSFNRDKMKGRLPDAETFPQGSLLVPGIIRGTVDHFQFHFAGASAALLDGRRARWSQNSFRFRGGRGGGAFIQDKPVSFGFEIIFPPGGEKADSNLMNEMQVVKYSSIDLRTVSNMGFQENSRANDGLGGWTDEGAGGNDLRNIPVGRQLFGGVPFSIVNPAENGGRSCIVLGNAVKRHLPDAVEIPMNAHARSLYFLHASAWGAKGEKIGSYRIRYADGDGCDIPLVIGKNITDWWTPADLEEAVVGWQGKSARRSPVGLVIHGWNNPHPQKKIQSILFSSVRAPGMPILIALTGSNQQVSLVRGTAKQHRTDLRGWVPFSVTELPLSGEKNPLDGSREITRHAPAGKYGFVGVRNGRFEFKNGKRAKFFGLALVGAACFPEVEQAETLAKHLAELGCNIVRLHLYDNNAFTAQNKPRVNIFGDGAASSNLSEKRMAQLDYLIAKLKEQGIYIYLDLDSARVYTSQDGVIVGKTDKFGNSEEKRGIYFDRATIAARKRFARELLLHRNPWTGLRYVEEPAIALIDLANENSVFLLDVWRKLDGPYLETYTKLWNAWLLRRYADQQKLKAAWGNSLGPDETLGAGNVKAVLPVGMPLGNWGGRDTPRLTDGIRFATELQTAGNREMYQYLHSLGVKIPITGSQPLFLNPPDLMSVADLDFVDLHPYFFGARPMLQGDIPDYDTITQIALARVKNKPLTVTEWNYHNKDIFPWRNDAPVFVAAYAALQDVDCLIAHSYSGTTRKRSRIEWSQEVHNDPVFIGQWMAASHVFLRGDVAPARIAVPAAIYDKDSVYLRETPQPSVGFNPFIHRLYTEFDATGVTEAAPPNFSQRLESDTGELIWHRTKGVFLLDSLRTRAVIGRLDRAEKLLSEAAPLKVFSQSENPQSIVVTSMDGEAVSRSANLLLTACGRCENSGMVWDASGSRALDRGRAPIMIEPVRARIELRGMESPESCRVTALNGDGTLQKEIPCHGQGEVLTFSLSGDTIFYRIYRVKKGL